MAVFGDDDPEDAWSAGDTPEEKVRVLVRWVASIAEELDDGNPNGRVRFRVDECLDRALPVSRVRSLSPARRAQLAGVLALLLVLDGLVP